MNDKNDSTDHSPTGDGIQAHIGPFMAGLNAAGYAAKTLGAKRVALDQFIRWRHRRKRPSRDLTQSEILEFLASSFQGDKSRRSVASRALFGFLD
jgi:site-specific recombinase XerD